jgi:hypothetical protein
MPFSAHQPLAARLPFGPSPGNVRPVLFGCLERFF